MPEGWGGYFQESYVDTDGTRIDDHLVISEKSTKDPSILFHEIQHAVQTLEGFAKGADFDAAIENASRAQLKTLAKEQLEHDLGVLEYLKEQETRTDLDWLTKAEITDQIIALKDAIKELQQVQNKSAASIKQSLFYNERAKHRAYLNVAGEVEARDVQKRLAFTKNERQVYRPDLIIDGPYDRSEKLIMRFMRAGDEGDAEPVGRIGNINVDNLRTANDIDYLLDKLAEDNPRETKTEQQVAYEARQLGMTPARVIKGRGVGNASAVLTAGREVLVNLLDDIANVDSRPGSSAKDYVARAKKYATLMAVHARVSQDTAEVARALRMLQMVSESKKSADEIVRMMKDAGNAIYSDPEAFARFDDLVRNMLAQGNAGGAIKMVRASFQPKAEDYIFSVWYNFLLSSPATHFVNIAGTGLNFFHDLAVKGFAAVAGQPLRFSKNTDRVLGREVIARLWGVIQAAKDAETWSNAGKSYITGQTGNFDNLKAENTHLVIPGKASLVLEAPTRALAAEDEWFRGIIQLSDIYGMAARKAGKEGLTGKAFWDRVSDLVNKPTPDMIAHAKHFTRVLQFQDEPSPLGRFIDSIRTRQEDDEPATRVMKGVMRATVPFVRTPDALIRTALRNMGPFAVLEREFYRGLKAGGQEEALVKARMVMSSAMMAFFAIQAANGDITGAGPSDWKKREEWLATHQPNSIKVNGKWYSIAGLEPFVSPILAVATAFERMQAKEHGETEYDAQATDVALGVASALADTAYTENLIRAMDIFQGGEQATAKLENWATGILSSLTVPAILRHYAYQHGDKTEYSLKGDESFSDKLSNRIIAGVKGTPIESTIQTMGVDTALVPKYDLYGRPKKRGEIFGPEMLSRIRTREEESDEAAIELNRLSKAMKGSLVSVPNNFRMVNNVKIDMTEQEFQDYIQLSGVNILENVRAVMQTPEWETMSDAQRRVLVKKIVTTQRRLARNYLFNNPPTEIED